MKTTMAAVVLGAALMTGCAKPTLSLRPLYTDSDKTFDQALVGTWTDEDAKDIFSIKQSKEVGYDVVYLTDDGEKVNFSVRLVPMGAFQFLDIAPQASSDLVIPGHFFAKISMDKGSLHLALLNWDWLKKELAKDPPPLANEVLGKDKDQILITAPTAQVREFVLRSSTNAEAFGEEAKLHRIR